MVKEIGVVSGSWDSEFSLDIGELEDPFPLRNWQQEALESLKSSNNRWLVAPPGSGKTTLMVALAESDLRDSQDKCLIAVPQNSIKHNYGDVYFKSGDNYIQIEPTIISTVSQLRAFLKSKPRVMNRRIAVCTHQSLCRIDHNCLNSDTRLWIDEAHHLSADDTQEDSINKIGAIVSHALTSGISVGIATATPGRADNCSLILKQFRSTFTEFELTLERHLKEHTEIESIRFNILAYGNDPVECVSKVYENGHQPTIIWLPNIQTINDKYQMADDVAKAIGPVQKTKLGWQIGDLVAINLVDEKHRKEKVAYIKNNSVDIIVSLDMFKEGDDYPKLARCIKLGVVRSPTANAQMHGRLYRHFAGKKEIVVYQAIPKIKETKNIGKFMSSLLTASIDIEMICQSVVVHKRKKIKAGAIWDECFDYDAKPELMSLLYGVDDIKNIVRITNNWCSSKNLTTEQSNRILASIICFLNNTKNPLRGIHNQIDLEIIEKEDYSGWYSKIIDQDELEKARLSIQDVVGKGQRLIQMAINDEPKPGWGHPLHKVLYDYTTPGTDTFNLDVTEQLIKKRRRYVDKEWTYKKSKKNRKLRKTSEIAAEILLEMAKLGYPRPHSRTYWGSIFAHLICESSPLYNEDFKVAVTKANSVWVIGRTPVKSDRNKKALIEIAKAGGPRPDKNSYLGRSLASYMNNRTGKHTEFKQIMLEITHHWFKRYKQSA